MGKRGDKRRKRLAKKVEKQKAAIKEGQPEDRQSVAPPPPARVRPSEETKKPKKRWFKWAKTHPIYSSVVFLVSCVSLFFTIFGGLPSVLGLEKSQIDCTKESADPYECIFRFINDSPFTMYNAAFRFDTKNASYLRNKKDKVATFAGGMSDGSYSPIIAPGESISVYPKALIRYGGKDISLEGDMIVTVYYTTWLGRRHHTSRRFKTSIDEKGNYFWRSTPMSDQKDLTRWWDATDPLQ